MVSLADLPVTIPLFLINEIILYPRIEAVFAFNEPEHLAMVEHAANTELRLFGIIQPKNYFDDDLFAVGCAAQIQGLSKKKDGIRSVDLRGFARFRVAKVISGFEPYKRAAVKWAEFEGDLEPQAVDQPFDRDSFIDLAHRHFDFTEWERESQGLSKRSDEDLINFVAMHGHFSPADRQALLEVKSLSERRAALEMLMKMNLDRDGRDSLQ